MSINLTDEIEVKTKKGKLGAAKQIFLEGDTQTIEKEIQDINSRHNDLSSKHESLSSTVSQHTNQIESNQSQITANKSAQDEKNATLDANIANLNTRDDQITETLNNITATGGASVASAVTYNNATSNLVSVNVQGAIDEVSSKVGDLSSQVLGDEKIIEEEVVLATIQTLSQIGFIVSDGESIVPSGAGIHSDFISIKDCSDMIVSGWAVANNIIFFYDADKSFISSTLSGKNLSSSVTIPSNAVYIRVNGLTADYLSLQSATEYATNVIATKTTKVYSAGLISDVDKLNDAIDTLGSDISELSSQVNGLVSDVDGLKTDVLQNGKDISALKNNQNNKYVHISFDDSYRILKYLSTNSPQSIFEEPTMAMCKHLHDAYGAVFSFYLFNDEINAQTGDVLWSIESTPTTYKEQFRACCDWIKFGYHTKNRNSNANDFTTEELTSDYARTISVIENCIGLDSLDRLPRLGGYAGTKERVLALRDTNAGIIGALGPDDGRQGYYMTSSEAQFLSNHDRFIDYENQLVFVKTDIRVEDASIKDNIQSVIDTFSTTAWSNKVRELILFTHEGVVFVPGNNIPENLERVCSWAITNGYSFDYPMNRL